MDTRPVYRCSYRAQLNWEADQLTARLQGCAQAAQALIDAGVLMTAALYYHGRQLFLYYEPIGEAYGPERFMAMLSPVLSDWPQKDGTVQWVPMYPVFWHSVPQNAGQWKRTTPPNARRGRIALLKHDTMFEYVYHHFALTQEGLLRGDQYMNVAMHEDMLFSYFEEPRSSVNISGRDEASAAIKAWMDTDPDSHFVKLEGSNGANFLLLPAYFTLGME